MIGPAINQRGIDSGNGFVKFIIEVESNHTVYFLKSKIFSATWVGDVMFKPMR